MYYRNRAELDRISHAGATWYKNEHGNPVVRMNAQFWLECEAEDTAFTDNAKRTGNWEAWVATAISREITESKAVFFDIGANVGYYTLMSVMANVPTVSYEPNHSVLELLNRSVRLNRAGSSELWIRPQALSDKIGTETFYVNPKHSGAGTIIPQTSESVSSDNLEKHEIHTVSLDDEFQNLPHFEADKIVLKVDAEGAERKIWSGSKNFRDCYSTVWFIEWVPERSSEEENEMFLRDVLETHDLQVVQDDGSLRPVGVGETLLLDFETLVLRKREA